MEEGTVGGHVLIIDDDAAMRDSLEAMLQARGMRARAFASADGLIDAHEAAATGCLLIDLNMPGTDGFECLRRLAERNIRLPAILMTGRADAGVDAQARAAGIVATILKPFQPADLVELIRLALARGAVGPQQSVRNGYACL